MRTLTYLFVGVLFGITMYKSEAASWFRIYEMFQFDSFHMYGIIGSSVLFGSIIFQIIKRFNFKSFFDKKEIVIPQKELRWKGYLFGGIIFGLGWALTGACPGPIFTLIGAGYMPMLLVVIASVFGTLFYGLVKDKLPH